MEDSGSSAQLGHQVSIPESILGQLTVAEIKTELKQRNVHVPSKIRKQQLLDLLRSSLHLPVVTVAEAPVGKKEKAVKWNKNHPAWQLLYSEMKAGNIPLDSSQMGPTAIYEKYCDTFELQMEGMQFGDTFISRLDDIRKKVLQEDPPLPWNECHPARVLLYNELESGAIPLDEEEMGPAEVYCMYASSFEFNLRGMEYSEKFEHRLDSLRKHVKGCKGRAEDDSNALKAALRNHPPPALNQRGRPQWNGSAAQAMLEIDVAAGIHKLKKPAEMWSDNDVYQQALTKDEFRWKIAQVVRTKKYLHTLKYKAATKLRENLKDLPEKVREEILLAAGHS